MVRVGVIGTGVMGVNHIRIYHEMEGVELVGISDIDEERVEELSRKYATEPFTDYKRLLRKYLDAISIVVLTKLHKQVCLDALEAGANVLVEKPIADTPENADIMIKAAKNAGKDDPIVIATN